MRLKFYYDYAHIRPDTNEVFYIGKGVWTYKKKFSRAYASDNRNPFWRHIVQKCGGQFEVNIVAAWDDHSACIATEQELIALYGRRDLGVGTLCNLTDGGEGILGCSRPVSLERREALRKRFSGAGHPNFGKKLSPETCRRKSEALKGDNHFLKGKKLPESWKASLAAAKVGSLNPQFGKHTAVSRRVINTVSGTEYPTVTAAATAEGFVMKTLYNMLSGHRTNRTTLRFLMPAESLVRQAA